MLKKSKKLFSLVLAAIMVFSVTATAASAATTLTKVKNVAVTSVDDDEINLKWSKVKGADGYQVYVRKGNSGSWKKAETTKKNYAEVEDLKGAQAYSIKVRAYDKQSGKTVYGSFSAVLNEKTAPDEPKNVSITALSEGKAKVKWSAVNGADGYRVYKYDTAAKKWVKLSNVDGTSYTVNVSKNGGDKFRVRAFVRYNSAHFSEASDTVVSGVNVISYSKAKSIALKNANVSADSIFGYEAEYEKKGANYVYEVEFETKKYEYEYVINAKTGKIISKDVERR